MIPPNILDLEQSARSEAFRKALNEVERYYEYLGTLNVSPRLDAEAIRSGLSKLDFHSPLSPVSAIEYVAEQLTEYQVHTPHPMYFGLFNPKPATMGVIADLLVAAFNPQLAAWSHSPFAVEAEQYVIREIGKRFGYSPADVDGTFTNGGAEANHTALLTALNWKFPEFSLLGVRGCAGQPRLYCTSQSHHSIAKAARLCGLGNNAVAEIPLDGAHRMEVELLHKQIEDDRSNGFVPFMIVATGGSTNAGIIDPIERLAETASAESLWLHVDAAWGGAAVLVPELRYALAGIDRADSITFDAHKWLSVPMAGGMFFTRHRQILSETFRITTDYMPKEGANVEKIDPYAHSMQWSRRFIGLKVFMSLLVAGWEGYASVLRHQTAMGKLLREELSRHQWKIVNDTPLPTVCFIDGAHSNGGSAEAIDGIAQRVIAGGKAWISSTRLGENMPVLRACITNYQTREHHVCELTAILNEARTTR